ncbi:MAG: TIGR00159 family protein [Anaerolineae bacterium]|nr:TIGR00159 family protein [Anaerolineae bacterium]NIN94048.1 TIGR00159 family protein [Anaerolineae bacterium]NIQ77089.1 TIGR00159 family protein [Anaerolineae bacterium]
MSDILWILSHFQLRDLVDIVIVTAIFWGLLFLVRGTRAMALMRGVLLLAIAVVLASNFFSLTAFNWLIRNTLPALLVAVPVIFQPELRRALERLGRGGGLITLSSTEAEGIKASRHIAGAAQLLSERKHGALIVLERETGLQEFVDTGVPIDGEVSAELLLTIFQPNTALHDGAAIIRGDRIVAAACILPLAETSRVPRGLGLRHRAAVGITEQSDALATIVSEETGTISLARYGRLVSNLDESRLRELLRTSYRRQWSGNLSRRANRQ